jgi:hypothetical protein
MLAIWIISVDEIKSAQEDDTGIGDKSIEVGEY